MIRVFSIALVGCACFATALMDISAALGGSAELFWLTSGIGVAGALLLRAMTAPTVGVAAALAYFAINASALDPWHESLLLQGLGIGVGQCVEVWLCAALLARLVGPHGVPVRSLDGLRWLIASLCAGLLGASLFALALHGQHEWSTAPLASWALSRISGICLLAPLLIAWALPRESSDKQVRTTERWLLHLVFVALTLAVFDQFPQIRLAPPFAAAMLLVPVIAGLRLGLRDSASMGFYGTSLAFWGTIEGAGPFALHGPAPAIPLMALFLTIPALSAVGISRVKAPHFPGRGITRQQIGDRASIPNPPLHESDPDNVRQHMFQTLYDAYPAMFFAVDASGRVSSVNRFGAEQLGYDPSELQGADLVSRHLASQRGPVRQHMSKCLQFPGRFSRWETCMLRSDGSPLWVKQSARSVIDRDLGPLVLLVCEDVTEARELSQQLTRLSRIDPLTSLINRREFERRLGVLLTEDERARGEHALLYLDLDQFKVINDTCGHAAGDTLLRQVARTLSGVVRRGDTLARLGGDEFGVLLERCALEQAMRVAGSVRAAIREMGFVWENRTFLLGVSIGVVPILEHDGDITEIMRAADAACYGAKDKGRNRVHVYRDDDAGLARRHKEMEWVTRISQALAEGRFHLCFQPIVPLQPGCGGDDRFELLLRMQDANGSIVLPGAFIPAAERFNLATRLDRWVVRTTLNWLRRRPELLRSGTNFNINLSGQSLADEEFRDFAETEFEQSGVPGERICFEITETAAITDVVGATNFIHALKALGCRFALDDFGAGLSSFGYLKTLPVDVVKIDGMFVKGMADDPIDRAMVKSINEIGRVMGKETVAEFVEHRSLLDRLREMNVGFAQGYGIGRPEPLDTFDAVRARRARSGRLVAG